MRTAVANDPAPPFGPLDIMTVLAEAAGLRPSGWAVRDPATALTYDELLAAVQVETDALLSGRAIEESHFDDLRWRWRRRGRTLAVRHRERRERERCEPRT